MSEHNVEASLTVTLSEHQLINSVCLLIALCDVVVLVVEYEIGLLRTEHFP